MSGIVGRLARVLGLFFCIAALTVALAPTASADDGDGANRFGACLAAQRSGQILLMIDESASLQTSDPDAARVTAAKYLTEQLARFAAESGVQVEVAVSGFSDQYRNELGWTTLDESSLSTVETSLDGFRTRNGGLDTDYWLALDGARSQFSEASGETGGQECRAVAWFSDGKLDFSPRGGVDKPYAPGIDFSNQAGVDQAVAAATESICRSGGLADQLRSSGIVTFGIGLAPEGSSAADFNLMKSIATGVPSPNTCGDLTAPIPGDFYLAQDIDDLLFAFDAFSTPGQAPLESEAIVCSREVCEEGKHRFVLDRSVGNVNVLATADGTNLVPTLVSPNGSLLPLDNRSGGTGDLGGVAIDYNWPSPKTVSFEMSNVQAPQWQGVWALAFVDPNGASGARSKSNIHISGNLFPAWDRDPNTRLHSDDVDVPVTFTIVDSQNAPIDPEDLLGKATFSATLVDKDGKSYPIVSGVPKDSIGDPVTMDLAGVPPGGAIIRLSLAVTTADATATNGRRVPGTALTQRSVDIPLTIDPPVGFPSLGSKIDFGTVEGSGSFDTSLTVTGPGCVWLPQEPAADVAAAPDGVDGLSVTSSATSAENCVRLTEGQEAKLPLTLDVPDEANGVVNGSVQVMVSPPDEADRAVAVQVPFTADLQKPLNTGNFLIALIVALILGPGVPLLLLYLAKWFTARIPARALRAQQIAITVNGGSVLRDGQPFAIRDRDLVELVRGLDTPARRLDLGGIELRTRTGLSPLGAGFVVAKAAGRSGAGSKSPAMHGKTPDARLPLAIHNSWFVVHDPAGPADRATVVLLAGGDAGPQQVTSLVEDMMRHLPRTLEELRSRASVDTPAGAGGQPQVQPQSFNPFGGSGPASGPQQAGDPFGSSNRPPSGDPFGGQPRSGPPQPPPPRSGPPPGNTPRPPDEPFDPFSR
ncbi:von Willebrand factor type A domain-containing protein [Williamsia muralis]|uniref:von Willebrand factor type A domain-containing protein n=1 Tax=Williamsia marianensis TaxID=85044 RepID=A0A495K757_WILMA|nr:vWA domain-containing protein [Williamsia muralis]RKR96605.1 von Willebrand factor type A domain-containing protein [Williamsia muralis]